MKKVIEIIAIIAIATFLGTLLIACVIPNPVPIVFGKVMVVSFAVAILYCIFGYDKPIKYVD